jgi:hypothetical protein
MSTEKQNQLIQQAIDQLPTYSAPDHLWHEIREQLDIDQKDNVIKATIGDLAQYPPPEAIWSGIQESLAQENPPKSWLKIVRQPLSWAASILILVSVFWWLNNNQKSPVSYTYTTQDQDQWLLESDWDTDEADFAEVVQLHQKYLHTFGDKSALNLQEELTELNNARQELKQALENYGKDRELIRQLAAIERARTQIINQMAQQI